MQQRQPAAGPLDRSAAAEGMRRGAALHARPPGRLGDALAAEASRYLGALEVFRREGCRVVWAAER